MGDKVWECGSAGGRLEYEVPGRVLMLERTIPAAVSNQVEVIVDGGAPVAISCKGHNPPVTAGLPAGLHRVAIVVHPYHAGEKDGEKVQIWWGGAAGVTEP